MKIIIEDAASACLEINAEDISCVEDAIWLKTLIEFLEYQHEYWQSHKNYANNLERLIKDENSM